MNEEKQLLTQVLTANKQSIETMDELIRRGSFLETDYREIASKLEMAGYYIEELISRLNPSPTSSIRG